MNAILFELISICSIDLYRLNHRYLYSNFSMKNTNQITRNSFTKSLKNQSSYMDKVER